MKILRFTAPLTAAAAASDNQTAITFDTRLETSGFVQNVRIYSDYRNTPLTLSASGLKQGDSMALLILPWRIELWVEGHLMDEEWPCGKLPIETIAEEALCNAGISVTDDPNGDDCSNMSLRAPDYTTDCGISANDNSPRILGRLQSKNGENPAEGWRPSDPGVFAGDCMPYKDFDEDGPERYHVLYLKDRRHHTSKWHKGAHQWAHMSTTDFRNWDFHPLTVSIDDPSEGSICTGSWLKTAEGIHYLYYTVRPIDDSPALLLRSVSEDGYHYRRDTDFSFVLSDRYHKNSARDPKIVKADDGYHMFVTTSLMTGEYAHHGCLAHITSKDGLTWTETEPIYISDTGDQPECPDYFARNGWYYLIFSLRGRGHYYYSRKPFSDWQKPADPIIPCENVPKMALWKDRILFTGFLCMNGYAGTLTFIEAEQHEDGTLSFGKMNG